MYVIYLHIIRERPLCIYISYYNISVSRDGTLARNILYYIYIYLEHNILKCKINKIILLCVLTYTRGRRRRFVVFSMFMLYLNRDDGSGGCGGGITARRITGGPGQPDDGKTVNGSRRG
jgi:uncharacterized membrane protein YgcG